MESGLLAYGNDMDSRHSVLECGLGGFLSLDADIDSLSLKALRAEQARGLERRLVGLMLDAPEGARAFAERPFESTMDPADIERLTSEAITLQSDTGHCLGSQIWSPRYRQQLGTAMLEEPLASERQIAVRLDDGTMAEATVCELPFDFSQIEVAAAV